MTPEERKALAEDLRLFADFVEREPSFTVPFAEIEVLDSTSSMSDAQALEYLQLLAATHRVPCIVTAHRAEVTVTIGKVRWRSCHVWQRNMDLHIEHMKMYPHERIAAPEGVEVNKT